MSSVQHLHECGDGVLEQNNGMVIKTIEMHTGGGPVRIVVSGFPNIIGDTLLDKRRYLLNHLNHARKMLLLEPRGHDAMYAVFLVKPDMLEADIAVLFSYGECKYWFVLGLQQIFEYLFGIVVFR